MTNRQDYQFRFPNANDVDFTATLDEGFCEMLVRGKSNRFAIKTDAGKPVTVATYREQVKQGVRQFNIVPKSPTGWAFGGVMHVSALP